MPAPRMWIRMQLICDCEHTLDAAGLPGDFAGTEPVTEEVELALFSGKATRRGVVTVRVRSEWLTAAHPLLGSIGDRSSTSRDIFRSLAISMLPL